MTLADAIDLVLDDETTTGRLRQAGYVLAEMPTDADLGDKVEALVGMLAVSAVVQARQAEQLDALTELVGKLAEIVEAVGPMATQLAEGGPGAILGLLAGRR